MIFVARDKDSCKDITITTNINNLKPKVKMKKTKILMLLALLMVAVTGARAEAPSGAQAVDLGLPSGTLWANMNIGATTESDRGNYYAWGATTTQSDYSQANAPYYNGSSYTKYNATDGKTTLVLTDDAAHQNWGSDWRMPTKDEMQELLDNTDHEWATIGDVNGMKFMKKTDHSVYIFLPAAGNMNGTNHSNEGKCIYWTSTLWSDNGSGMGLVCTNSPSSSIGHDSRRFGFSVRPVKMFAGAGTSANPYQISNSTDWANLVTNVNAGETYSGKYFKMTANVGIVTTWMTGDNSTNTFKGTFDGDGHTLTVNYSASGTQCAPFGWLISATIENLNVAGTITTTGNRPASIAATAEDCTFRNCTSSVDITASTDNFVDGGGLVARVYTDKTITMTGCAFTGSITYSGNGYYGGGLLGKTIQGATATLTDCVFAPSAVTLAKESGVDFYMFSRVEDNTATLNLNNCYYYGTGAANSKITVQGLQAFRLAAGSGVATLGISGEGTEYDVSGITAYTGGIKFGGNYYGGSGQAVSLALTQDAPAGGTFWAYSADKGTVGAQTATSATITMPAANSTANDQVTLGAVYEVDLGLPSHTRWATMNVGAGSETGAGNYYAWGATSTQSDYSLANAPYYSGSAYTKYNATDGKTTLELSDDAANANWGGTWRMPSKVEINELCTDANITWTWDDENKGYRVTGKNGASIFLPAAGDMNGSDLVNNGSIGWYWSSDRNSSKADQGGYLRFTSSDHNYTDGSNRRYGFPVRAVKGFYCLSEDGSTPADNKTQTDVYIVRTLNAAGWNTFCVPFDISAAKVSALGLTVKQFTGATLSSGTLTLSFSDAESIAAGTPYLVKPAANIDFTAAGNEFAGVTQDWTAHSVNGGDATFVPALEPVSMTGGDKTTLFVANGGATLTYPVSDGSMKGFRAYFSVPGGASLASAFVLDFGDGETTGVRSIDNGQLIMDNRADAWYMLDGRRLSKEPTKSGVYVVNGKKTVIK